MFKLHSGDVCMIKYAPEAYDELNGYVVKLTQASIYAGVESWYSEEKVLYSEEEDLIKEDRLMPVPEAWLWKFGTEKDKK